MSIFQGRLDEYPFICVDNFTPETHIATAFFLSHCHKDHMKGLDSELFLELLKSDKKCLLYCSETTKNLAEKDKRLRLLYPYMEGIPLSQPRMIHIPDANKQSTISMTITLIPAGHCIGSVMFLFEGQKGAVLYTGDFRIKKGDIRRVECLKTNNVAKSIKGLYIDTTFCIPLWPRLPQREETKATMIGLMTSWLKNGDNYAVFIECSAIYGYEYIFKELSIEFNFKIHVDDYKFDLYSLIPGMTEYVTKNGEATQIHSCCWKNSFTDSSLPCGRSQRKKLKIMKIKPSTLWFFNKNAFPSDNVSFDKVSDIYRVVHSMHASYEEIVDVVSYLQPEYVYPTVLPYGADDVTCAFKRLKDLLFDIKVERNEKVPQIRYSSKDSKREEKLGGKSSENNWKLASCSSEQVSLKRAKLSFDVLGIEDEICSLPNMLSSRRRKKFDREMERKRDGNDSAATVEEDETIELGSGLGEIYSIPKGKSHNVGKYEEMDGALNDTEKMDLPATVVRIENQVDGRKDETDNTFDIPLSPGISEPSDEILGNYYLKFDKMPDEI